MWKEPINDYNKSDIKWIPWFTFPWRFPLQEFRLEVLEVFLFKTYWVHLIRCVRWENASANWSLLNWIWTSWSGIYSLSIVLSSHYVGLWRKKIASSSSLVRVILIWYTVSIRNWNWNQFWFNSTSIVCHFSLWLIILLKATGWLCLLIQCNLILSPIYIILIRFFFVFL